MRYKYHSPVPPLEDLADPDVLPISIDNRLCIAGRCVSGYSKNSGCLPSLLTGKLRRQSAERHAPETHRKTEDYQVAACSAAAVDLGFGMGALDATMIVGGVVEELISRGVVISTNCACALWVRFTAAERGSLLEVEMRGASLPRLIQVKPKQG